MRDTECGGGPMNMSWDAWQEVHGLDADGTLLQTDSPLTGSGALSGLPPADPRRGWAGHLYQLDAGFSGLFADGFEP